MVEVGGLGKSENLPAYYIYNDLNISLCLHFHSFCLCSVHAGRRKWRI